MPAAQPAAPPAKTIRIIHAAMVTGVLIFAVVGHFVLKPSLENSDGLPPTVVSTLLGVALGACVLSHLLRRRVPHRSNEESLDVYWTRAATPALITWAPLEGASLMAVYLYARTGQSGAVAVAVVAVLLFVVSNPASFERR